MGGSPPPCHGYVCANGTAHSGCTRSKNVTNCKSCYNTHHLYQNHWSDPGPECKLKVYPYCHNGEPLRNYWNWWAYHYCEPDRCHSHFFIHHHLQCKRRVDRLDWGSHAPTHAFPGNRGGTTLSSYYYIMFLNQHLNYAGWTPPVGIYMDASYQYWIDSSSIPRIDANVDLHHTLPSYGTVWELGIYIHRAQYDKLFRSGAAHRTSGWIHIKPEFRTVRVKKYNGNGTWSNGDYREFIKISRTHYSYYHGAGNPYCAGIHIHTANRHRFRRYPTQEGYVYIKNHENKGSYQRQVSWSNGYWAKGKNNLDYWNNEDIRHYSDSHFIRHLGHNSHLLVQFIKKHSRTHSSMSSTNINKLIGIIFTDTGSDAWRTDLDRTRYFISYDELAKNWKENFKAKCDGDWTDSNNQNKCPPDINIQTINADIHSYDFYFGSAPTHTSNYNDYNYPNNNTYPNNDKINVNSARHFKIRIFVTKKNVRKNALIYNTNAQRESDRYKREETIKVVWFQIIKAKDTKWNTFNRHKVFHIVNDIKQTPAACPPGQITINKYNHYSECSKCDSSKNNFYTYGPNTTNKNECVSNPNIDSLPGQYLRLVNDKIVNVNLVFPEYNSTIIKYKDGHFHTIHRTSGGHTLSSTNGYVKYKGRQPTGSTELDIYVETLQGSTQFNEVHTHSNATYPPGRIFIDNTQYANIKGRPPSSRLLSKNIINNVIYDTDNRYFPYTTILTDSYEESIFRKHKYIFKAGVYPITIISFDYIWWEKWLEGKTTNNLPDPSLSNDFILRDKKDVKPNEFIIPGGYLEAGVKQTIIEDDTTYLKSISNNYEVDKTRKKVYEEKENTLRLITDNKVVSMKTENLENAYYNLKTTIWHNSIADGSKKGGRFSIRNNLDPSSTETNPSHLKTMKAYIDLYNKRILSNISTDFRDTETYLAKNNNSPFPQPQKELIAKQGEIIKFNHNKPNEIINLKDSKKYNPYGKRYSPYNEIFNKFPSSGLNKNVPYITLDLGKISTIIGIGCKRKNTANRNTFTGLCRIGYGYEAETNTGFLMNYLFNKDKRLFKFDNNKKELSPSHAYSTLNPKIGSGVYKNLSTIYGVNAPNYVDNLRESNNPDKFSYNFLLNSYKDEFKNFICVSKIQPCVARYIRILPIELQHGWHDMDYYIITQEERYYITNDVVVNENSNWIRKTKQEFDTKYNIRYDQKQEFSGGSNKVEEGKYIRYKSKDGANINLSDMDNRLYDCPVGTYSDSSLELGEFCKPKTTHCKPSEYLSLSNNQKKDNICISGYDDINNNIINRKKSYDGTKAPHQTRFIKYNGNHEKNQWWFYNRDEPENPAYSDFYIEKNDKTYYSTIYNNAEKIVIDGSKESPLHNRRSYTFTLKSNQICPKKLYNGDGVSNIYLQDSRNSLYKQDVNKYAEFDIKEISEKDGVKTYEITRMDPSPHPNQEETDIEPPRNLDFKLVFFCNYNTSDNNKFEKIKSRTLKCPPGKKLQLATPKLISNKNNISLGNQSIISQAIGSDYNQKGLYFYIENDNNLYFSNNSNFIVKDATFNTLNSEIKSSTNTAKQSDVINLCQNDFGNEWRLATGDEMNHERISMGAQAWYNSGSPNEPTISYGYPRGYYAKPGNPWSIANYIDISKDKMQAMCIKPNIEFLNHAYQNGWIPNINNPRHSIYKDIKGPNNIFNSYTFPITDKEFLDNVEDIINTKILTISSDYETYLSNLKNKYQPLRFNKNVEYIIKSNSDLDNSIVIIPAYKSKENSDSKTLEKAGVRELVSEKSDNTSIVGTKWKLDNIYINNRKNIVADIISVELPEWNFNNNIYSAQFYDDKYINSRTSSKQQEGPHVYRPVNDINIPHIVNNIEFVKTNKPNIYYLKNAFKDEYLYIKNTENYGENGKSILWHKGGLPVISEEENISLEEKLKIFEFKFEINTDKPNIDLSILYSPFNIAQTWGQDQQQYYIQTYNNNNDTNYLTTYSDNIGKLGKIRLSSLDDGKIQSWFIESIKLNNKGNIEMLIKTSGNNTELSKSVYTKVINELKNLSGSSTINNELIPTYDYNTYYIRKKEGDRNCYLYYDETVTEGHNIYWKFINIPDNDNYKFKFTKKNIVDNIPTATTIYNNNGPFKSENKLNTLFEGNKEFKIFHNRQQPAGLAEFYKTDETSVETDLKQQNYLQDNECVKCNPNEYIDMPNHDFEKCFPKTQCDNNQEYIHINKKSTAEDNVCHQLDYYMFRKKKDTLEEDTSTKENMSGKYVTNIDSIIVSLALIICFWNIKTTYLYLKDEFNIGDIPSINEEIKNNSRLLLIDEMKKLNSKKNHEKKFKWMLLKIFQIQKIWKFDFDNINIDTQENGKINEEHSKILQEKNMSEFLGETTTDKLDTSTLTSPFFNIDTVSNTTVNVGLTCSLYNVHSNTYLSIDKNNINNIIQSDKVLDGRLSNNIENNKFINKPGPPDYTYYIWTIINGGTGVDENNNPVKMVGLYNHLHNKLLLNEGIEIKTYTAGKNDIDNYRRIEKNNHILDYEFQHLESARFIVENGENGTIKLKTNYINNGVVTSSYLGVDDNNNYRGYSVDEYDPIHCEFDILYLDDSLNYSVGFNVNNTELINQENSAIKLINENNYDIFFNKIFVLEEYIKTLFINILYYYHIYYLEGCNNNHLVEFNLENNYPDDSLYKKYIKTNLRTLKTLIKIFNLQDDIYNIADSSKIINNYLTEKLVTLHEQCKTDQYSSEKPFTDLEVDDIDLNIEGYDNLSNENKNRLNNSLKSNNNIININKKQDTKLFKNDDVSKDIIKPSTNTAKQSDVINLCQNDFGNEWRLATGDEMNHERISMGAQAWYNSGSPNEPTISYGYPRGYYAKPGNPWSIANYIDTSKDKMQAMCIKPSANDKLDNYDEHKLMCTKNDERYIKCNLIDDDTINKLLQDLKTSVNQKEFYNLNNQEFYNYYTELNNLTLMNKNNNKENMNNRIFEVNKLYKLLNKGCRSPISELTTRHDDNTYKYTKGNVEFNKLDDNVYQNIGNDIKDLNDDKLNTKQKCYDFISSKDGSNNVDFCCNNTACIPDCNDYENRDDVKVSDNENIISNLNTYSIDKKYDELYSKTNYNIDRNTAIMEDKYNLTELGCYKNLGTIDNYRKFIPTITEYNNKTSDSYDLNNIEAYGNQSSDLNKKLDNNIEEHEYSTQDIIDTKSARNNKTKTLVDNVKYKLDNAHVDYGQSENKTENIDACLPRINDDYKEYLGIRDNSFKLSNDISDEDKIKLKKSYSYDIVNDNETLNFENASTKYLRDYNNNINKNINNIKTKQSKLPDKLQYLDSIGCYNETPYREYLVDKHFDDEKLECDKDDLTNNNCIINNYNEEYNKTKYINQRDTLNEEKYIKSYKLCRGENFKNINDENNDNLVENNIQYHLYYRKKYMNSFTSQNKDRKLKVLKILYYKMKNNNIEDDDKYYNQFFKNNQNDLSIKRNMKLMVQIFRDIINLSEIRYWANLLKVFYVNNKIEYPDDKEYRTKFLKLVYLNLTYRVNILEFLHACSFNLKVNLKIFGDKHVTEYVEIRHDIEYDKNIWKKMRAKDMNELFLNAENIKIKNMKKNNEENTSLECPKGSSQQGELNADIPGCGITGCDNRKIDTIEKCRIECIKNNDCKAFTYAPIEGDKNYLKEPVCTLYESSTPTDTWGPNQIFCKIEQDQSYQDNDNIEPSELILNESEFIEYPEESDKIDFSLKA